LIDQSEKKILQIDQSKNASKHLQHHIDRTLKLIIFNNYAFFYSNFVSKSDMYCISMRGEITKYRHRSSARI